jgi:hypothetical protein
MSARSRWTARTVAWYERASERSDHATRVLAAAAPALAGAERALDPHDVVLCAQVGPAASRRFLRGFLAARLQRDGRGWIARYGKRAAVLTGRR